MEALQIEAMDEPFRSDPELASRALRLLSRAEYIGCRTTVPTVLNRQAIAAVGRCLRKAKLPSAKWGQLLAGGEHLSAARLREVVDAMNEQIEMSPLPGGEWDPLVKTLGEELLGTLLGISVSSVRRYHAGVRATPQAVAERLHVVALLVADLAGSYNEFGIRRWFTRPRTALASRRPVDLLGAGFDPETNEVNDVQRLAASLIAPGAA
jgi:hypothetical protein